MAALRRPIQRLLPDEIWTMIQAQSRSPYNVRPMHPPSKPSMGGISLTHSFSTSQPSFASSTQPNDSTSSSNSHSTVDPTELSHFARLAESWWDTNGPSRLLHLMNPLRHTFIQSCLSSQAQPAPEKQHYLDIGCGGGIFAETAARLKTTASVTAIDPSPDVLAVAKEHARQDPILLPENGKLKYLNCSIEALSARQECRKEGYDIVTIFEVLEHVSQPSAFLDTVLRHVKPGGWIVLSTIARTWTSWFVTKVMAEEVLGFVPKGTHEWRKYVNEQELREWFEKRDGWGSARSMGVMYVPGFGWREVPGGEGVGNYFFGVRKDL